MHVKCRIERAYEHKEILLKILGYLKVALLFCMCLVDEYSFLYVFNLPPNHNCFYLQIYFDASSKKKIDTNSMEKIR